MLSLLLFATLSVPSEPVVVGYMPDWAAGAIPNVDFSRVTDVVAFSLEVDAQGELDSKWMTENSLELLREERERHGFRLLIAVGGWERTGGFAEVAASPELRKRFAANINAYCDEHDLDGVDLDWEHPSTVEQERDYGLLMKELRATLGPEGRLVTAAMAGWQGLGAEGIDALDRLHLMSYDHGGRHSTLDLAKSDVQAWLDRGMPAAKIALGVPFYGRGIENRNEYVSYADILERFAPKPEEDEAGGLYFNGTTTTEAKAAWARERGLAGIMIWELSQDVRGERALLRAVEAGLGRTTTQ